MDFDFICGDPWGADFLPKSKYTRVDPCIKCTDIDIIVTVMIIISIIIFMIINVLIVKIAKAQSIWVFEVGT